MLERKLPITTWDEVAVEPAIAENWQDRCGTFLFSKHDRQNYAPILRGFDGEGIDWDQRVEDIAAGKLSYFSNEPQQVGFPPKWNDNLFQDKPGPPLVHFSKIDEFGCGDVKCIWEPSRFGFAFDLVRAYWRTGNERAAEVFWQAAEDWLEHNPPNRGINWKCGQESTFRAMAWCFALWGFADCEATTPERVLKALKLMRATARRVEAHLGYALSQRNNHGVSEAMGLFTIGLLFPFIDESPRWVELGQKHLERQAQSLIYDDGGFAQHSANYHRVMLDDYLYAIRIGQLNDQPLSDLLKQRVAKAGRFLHAIMDPSSGRVARYGQDDGALILPLTNRPYEDYRPVVKAASSVCGDALNPVGAGPWDEEAVWLSGDDANHLNREITPANDFSAVHAGCHVLRSKTGMAFVRAQKYVEHRPSQLDQLHVDIWWKGINVALDPGTYCYNAEGAWSGIPLSKTAAHNTLMVEGKEQAKQVGSRFIFLPWPQAEAGPIVRSADNAIAMIDLVGPDRRFARRVLRLGDAHWLVLDQLAMPLGFEPSSLHWHLTDAPSVFDRDTGRLMFDYPPGRYAVTVGAVDGALAYDVERAAEASPTGWYAPRYMAAAPALRMSAVTAPGPAKLFSFFGPNESRALIHGRTLQLMISGRTLSIDTDAVERVSVNAFVEDLARQWSI